MTDDQQRARELLAQEYERDGITHVPDCIRREAMLTEMEHRAVRAITAALRAAPEVPDGFVMVQVRDARALYQHALTTPHNMAILAAHRVRDQIAARPQGVKDA